MLGSFLVLFYYADIVVISCQCNSFIIGFTKAPIYFSNTLTKKGTMAVIKRGILGGFQNKIANVVGSSWKGIATMRSLPISVANPRTAAQVTQRNRFKQISQFSSQILTTIIKPLWDRFAQQESGYNAFIRNNIVAFDGTEMANPELFDIAIGTISASPLTSSGADSSLQRIQITWNATPGGDSLGTDQAYVVAYNVDSGAVKGFANVALRSAGTWGADGVMANAAGTTLYIFLAFRRADGSNVSNTTWTSASVIA